MLTDDEFREEYKPIQIPAHYDVAESQEHKVIFALAQIGEGTADDVIEALENLEKGITNDQLKAIVPQILNSHYEKGLLSGNEKDGILYFNLHKITQANDGSTNPDLLAPGLD
jgi:hypothetical protein